MPTNEQNLASFQTAVNSHNVTAIMNLFCQDNPPGVKKPNYPCLGITDHGPAFFGQSDINDFFNQLFKTFSSMAWTWPPPTAPTAPVLISTDGNTLGVQMTVTGTYQNPWFQPPSTHASPPLSQLGTGYTGSLGKNRNDTAGLPACAVFTFDGSNKIRQLQMYLDRYALMQSIMGPDLSKTWSPDAPPHY
jgi:hypothetical protein